MDETGIRKSISGIRGRAEHLSGAHVQMYTQGFGTFLRDSSDTNTVVVARDTRANSFQYSEQVIQALLEGGWDVIDLGVAPTPTAQIAIAKFEAAGGVVITASHNPKEYNGLKFLQNMEGHGMFLRREQLKHVFDLCERGSFDRRRPGERRAVAELSGEFNVPSYTKEFLARHRNVGPVENAPILDYHMHRVISVMGRDLDVIRARAFSAVMDCCGGAGSPLDYIFLDYLYARVKRVNDAPGVFPRPIEPTPENLSGLCAELARDSVAYDVGFVTDCDNDRCVLVARDPDTGAYAPLEEDYTFAVVVDHVLRMMPPGRTVVTNWATSQMIKDICSLHHANLRRVPTGEVYTSSDALHFHAAIAGEGSCAGVIDPRVGLGRDMLVAMWHVLAALAHQKRGLNEIVRAFPKYFAVNRDHRVDLVPGEIQDIVEELQTFYAAKHDLAFLSREDGLIVALQDHSRIQIRASNTEPKLRVRTASRDAAYAETLAAEALQAITAAAKKASKE